MPTKSIALLSLPAPCTGDFWHNVAAQLLWSKKSLVPGISLQTALSIEGNRFTKEFDRLAPVINYFKTLNLSLHLLELEHSDLKDKSHNEETYERLLSLLSAEQISRMLQVEPTLHSQKHIRTSQSQDSLLQDGGRNIQAEILHLPSIHHYVATSIIMSYLHSGISMEERKSYHDFLRENLARNLEVDSYIEKAAAAKAKELKELVKKLQSHAGKVNSDSQVVLFLYRKGSMNTQQDVKSELWTQVQEATSRKCLVLIRVPLGLPPDEILNEDLDLFDLKADSNLPFPDKRYIVRFWAHVYKMPEIFGVVGPRTGSLDIAAFVGINCFEWDEPLLETAHKGFHSEEYLQYQIPQHLRFLLQRSIMSIGLLEPDSFSSAHGGYKRLKADPLERWIKGEHGICPTLYMSREIRENWKVYISDNLERRDLGVHAFNLWGLWDDFVETTGPLA